MEYLHSNDFIGAIRCVYDQELHLQREVDEYGNTNEKIEEADSKAVLALLNRVETSFPPKDFARTSAVVARVYSFATTECTYQELYVRVVGLRETMEDELRGRNLIVVAGDKAEYCENENLLGEEVSRSFPSTRYDFREAANCYAVGLNRACVFHLMRVLEVGLRVLAMDVGIPFKTEAWGRILDRIESAIVEIRRSSKREDPRKKRLHVYSQCVVEFGNFKDAWRNFAVHETDRHSYDEHYVRSIMEHVKYFMRSLAAEFSESAPLTGNGDQL
jgi:hypothetical protein